MVALFSGRGFTQSGTSEAAASPCQSLNDTNQSSRAPYLSGLCTIPITLLVPALGRLSPQGRAGGAASWLRSSTDNQGVPREPPSSCPSPCLSCSMTNPHPNACFLFFAKKPHDQERLRRLQQKCVSTCNSQNYGNKQIDSITKIDTGPIQGDWYIHYKMLELQPDHIYMKKSLYANPSSTGEGCTGEEKQHSTEIQDAWQIGNLR